MRRLSYSSSRRLISASSSFIRRSSSYKRLISSFERGRPSLVKYSIIVGHSTVLTCMSFSIRSKTYWKVSLGKRENPSGSRATAVRILRTLLFLRKAMKNVTVFTAVPDTFC